MSADHGQRKGEQNELQVALDVMDYGGRISHTYGHSHPYDLIADYQNQLYKIQAKSTHQHKKGNQYFIRLARPGKYSSETVDLFAGYVSEHDSVFYVPYDEMGKRQSVTFTPPEQMGSEANRERANLAVDYTFTAAISRVDGRR